jgi:hypothetical protein
MEVKVSEDIIKPERACTRGLVSAMTCFSSDTRMEALG